MHPTSLAHLAIAEFVAEKLRAILTPQSAAAHARSQRAPLRTSARRGFTSTQHRQRASALPRLKVRGRQLVQSGEGGASADTPFFWAADTAWNMLIKANETEASEYFAHRKSQVSEMWHGKMWPVADRPTDRLTVLACHLMTD